MKAAEAAYTQGIELDLPKGSHMLYANRSGVRLTLGNSEGALKLAPSTFTTAHIRKVCKCAVRAFSPSQQANGNALFLLLKTMLALLSAHEAYRAADCV